MIQIREKSSSKRLAYLEKAMESLVEEEINRGFVLSFSHPIDNIKSQYIHYENIVEVDNNYFNIAYYVPRRSEDGELMIDVECEHVSYDLNDPEYDLEFFTVDGTPTQILTQLLAGTPFTIGTVEFSNIETFSIQEKASRRLILVQLAEYLGGELLFEKYKISLLQRRGSKTGVEFRLGKNNLGVEKIVDAREKVNGLPKISYGLNYVELSTLTEYGKLEKVQLGDDCRLIDRGLNIKSDVRVVKYSYNPVRKVISRVELQNFTETILDTINTIERSTVIKDKLYYGIRIGPNVGFESVRSDKKSRSVMNADEFKFQRGDGEGNWIEDTLYANADGTMVLAGIYTGELQAEQIVAGTIDANTINIINLNASNIVTGTLDANVIDVINLNADNITSGSINANIIDVYNLNADNIVTGELYAIDIYGSTIQGSTIIGGQILANTDIDITRDLKVGRNIYLEQGTNNSKRIEFADNSLGAYIQYYPSGLLDIFSWGDVTLESNRNMIIKAFDDLKINAYNVVLPDFSYIGSISSNNFIATFADIREYADSLMVQHIQQYHS
ncbi:phage minor structural protein [Clostridium aceticum]|uniref:Phage minor structural protein n=1 Tax=Clostridium aceticum TaxID=84022 RepID=A0A0D8I7T0_9CLOT|nr:phage tail spike protein [Clostridium aceticum]AKL96610.1 phage minor structural protein [Clostridium aceticum]KJF26082.1 hypothetical protein TZ02_15295 [Clostridium aceticum]